MNKNNAVLTACSSFIMNRVLKEAFSAGWTAASRDPLMPCTVDLLFLSTQSDLSNSGVSFGCWEKILFKSLDRIRNPEPAPWSFTWRSGSSCRKQINASYSAAYRLGASQGLSENFSRFSWSDCKKRAMQMQRNSHNPELEDSAEYCYKVQNLFESLQLNGHELVPMDYRQAAGWNIRV